MFGSNIVRHVRASDTMVVEVSYCRQRRRLSNKGDLMMRCRCGGWLRMNSDRRLVALVR